MCVVIGVEIGQKKDPTAICVAEFEDRQVGSRSEVHFPVRYLERLPLGTPYPDVTRRLAEVAQGARARTTDKPDARDPRRLRLSRGPRRPGGAGAALRAAHQPVERGAALGRRGGARLDLEVVRRRKCGVHEPSPWQLRARAATNDARGAWRS